MLLTFPDSVILLLCGTCAGLLAGLLGVGGGLIMMPVLLFWLATKGQTELIAQSAVAMSLAAMIPASLSSVRAHWHKNGVDLSFMAYLIPGLLCGVVIGVQVIMYLNQLIIMRIFAVYALLAAWALTRPLNPLARKIVKPGLVDSIVGVVIGTVSSLVGIGVGSFTVPWLIFRGLSPVSAIASSALGGLLIAMMASISFVVASISNYDAVLIDIKVVALMALPAVLTASLGARFAYRVNPQKLRYLFALFLLIVAVKLSGFF